MATIGTKAELIEHLQKYCDDTALFVMDLWCRDDVLEEAQNGQVEITDEQADKALEIIAHHYDANSGINWIVVDCAIDEVKARC